MTGLGIISGWPATVPQFWCSLKLETSLSHHILDSLIDLEMDIPNKITTVSFVTGMRRSVLGFLVPRELAVVRVDQDMNTNFASIHKSS
jgi:hypothetical protein